MLQGKSKIAIIGAGYVGAAIAYNVAINRTASEIVLIDVNNDKAMGEALDINHGLCHLGQMNIHAGDYSECANCDAIVMTAGLNRKPGETRLDLATKNIPVAKSITENIMKYYNHGVIIVVANPADVLTYLIQKWSGLPANKVFGTGTALDSARFRFYLAQRLNVDIQNVHGYIIGEHGDSQVPVWSATQIAGQSVDIYCKSMGIPLSDAEKLDIVTKTKNGGAEVIRLKGATYFAIAGIVENIIEAVVKDKNSIKTVASVLDGQYGIHDVALSLPSVINQRGVDGIIQYSLTPQEEEALINSAKTLRAFIAQLSNT
ncbi:L-lactate dehydrogenase [bioreactor metagenome]|uniref:L-lactate dehydrogenase n=1 Tax=bioreactor metagenome TaxID=1076179 RepID=A0A644Z3P3_9ZZZZ